MFSKTFGYALRAVVLVAQLGQNGRKLGLQEISDQLEIPHHFLGKIMQDMVKHGIVDSLKGPTGGFFANKQTPKIPIWEVLKVTDGSLVFETCALGIQRCNAAAPCPLHGDFAVCRNGMQQVFSEKTIGDLAENVAAGLAFLIR